MKTRANGFSLLETMLALALLLIVTAGLLPLGMLAVTTTENQGHLMARTTEYAQDKMEQLLALSFGDTISDTRVFPAASTGGSGLTVGGASDPTATPVDKYVDYLDADGHLLPSVAGAAPSGWYYKRMWQVEAVSTTLKRISVSTIVSGAFGHAGRIPRATVVSLKTSPF